MLLTVQYLRGVAALMVVFHHALNQLNRHGSGTIRIESHIGQAGVDIFFVISGFIMFYIISVRKPTPTSFWLDRAIRVVPLYWFYTLLMILIAFVLPNVLKTAVFDVSHSIKSLLFIPTFHPKMESNIWPILVQGWTLNYEMFFYLLFGGTLFIKTLKGILVTQLGIFILLTSMGVFIISDNPLWRTYTNPLLLEFLSGTVLGYLVHHNKLKSKLFGLVLFVSGVCGLVLNVYFPELSPNRILAWGIPSFLIVAGAISIELNSKVSELKTLKVLGDSSYSLYLVHTFVLGVIGFGWSRLSISNMYFDILMIAVCLVISSLAGYVSYVLIEKPTTKYLKSHFH
jgi:exopolysaccharide production protein ExoZ